MFFDGVWTPWFGRRARGRVRLLRFLCIFLPHLRNVDDEKIRLEVYHTRGVKKGGGHS